MKYHTYLHKGCGCKSVYFQFTAYFWKYTDLLPHPLILNIRQLGFNYGIGHPNSYFGDVEEDFYVMWFGSYDDCNGNEKYLQQCEYVANYTGSLHTAAFGVECF